MRLGDLDRLAKDIEMAVEDAPLHVQATVQQYIDYAPTIDPIRAAGGCYCRECMYRNTCDHTVRIVPGGPGKGCLHGNLHGCECGVIGEPSLGNKTIKDTALVTVSLTANIL